MSGARLAWLIAAKGLRRLAREPLMLVVWVGIPVVVGGLLLLVAGGRDGEARARVLVADHDSSFVSRLLLAAADQREVRRLVSFEPAGEVEGRREVARGRATALIVLPAGFQDAVLREEPAELLVVTNPAQRIFPQAVRTGAEMLVEGVFYLHQLVGPELRVLAAGPPPGSETFSDVQIAEVATRLNARLKEAGAVLFPPVLSLGEPAQEQEAVPPARRIGLIFIPGLLFMSLLMVAEGLSEDLWRERDLGTLRRLLTTPAGVAPLLGGKLLQGSLAAAVVSAVGLAVALAFGASPGRFPLALAWCVLAGTMLLALFLAIQVFASNRRGGRLLSSALMFPMMMVGGSFFPFEAMPAWMAAVGRWTPNGLALARLRELLEGTSAAGPLLLSGAGLALAGALAVGVTLRRLGGRFALE